MKKILIIKSKIIHFFHDPEIIINKFLNSKISHILTDEAFLKLRYKVNLKKRLDLKNPLTFNEKLQWLKIYDRKPEYVSMVDKYRVREIIKKIIGGEYLVPLLGVWDDFDQIDFERLPDTFVLKCNHDSGSTKICNKQEINISELKKYYNKKISDNLFWWGREWPYKNVQPKIIAEQFLDDEDLNDYKFMCFNGKVKCSFICSERFSSKGLHVTFFDRNWNPMPFERHYPKSSRNFPKPINYEKMIELAELLSKNVPFLRVDFYNVRGKIYFGELTFFPGAGFEEFTPNIWDYTLGSWLELPVNKKGEIK